MHALEPGAQGVYSSHHRQLLLACKDTLTMPGLQNARGKAVVWGWLHASHDHGVACHVFCQCTLYDITALPLVAHHVRAAGGPLPAGQQREG
jgi:hypothetical protein